jgi:hypothetical protein
MAITAIHVALEPFTILSFKFRVRKTQCLEFLLNPFDHSRR